MLIWQILAHIFGTDRDSYFVCDILVALQFSIHKCAGSSYSHQYSLYDQQGSSTHTQMGKMFCVTLFLLFPSEFYVAIFTITGYYHLNLDELLKSNNFDTYHSTPDAKLLLQSFTIKLTLLVNWNIEKAGIDVKNTITDWILLINMLARNLLIDIHMIRLEIFLLEML